jgi:hypothetical protein
MLPACEMDNNSRKDLMVAIRLHCHCVVVVSRKKILMALIAEFPRLNPDLEALIRGMKA